MFIKKCLLPIALMCIITQTSFGMEQDLANQNDSLFYSFLVLTQGGYNVQEKPLTQPDFYIPPQQLTLNEKDLFPIDDLGSTSTDEEYTPHEDLIPVFDQQGLLRVDVRPRQEIVEEEVKAAHGNKSKIFINKKGTIKKQKKNGKKKKKINIPSRIVQTEDPQIIEFKVTKLGN
jgi:hypothetical protein